MRELDLTDLTRREPSRRFTYGYGRVEDLAGVVIVLTILLSAVLAGYQSVDRLLHPEPVKHLWAVTIASLIELLHPHDRSAADATGRSGGEDR